MVEMVVFRRLTTGICCLLTIVLASVIGSRSQETGGAFGLSSHGDPLHVGEAVVDEAQLRDVAVDENGYVLFCLCMGRLGNQIAHFLGGLAFAKSINRTLILPPFRSYKNVAFEDWFDASAVAEHHRVITATEFFRRFGKQVWPQEKRVAMCFQFPSSTAPCRIEGNPFANFWDELGIHFDKFETFYLPLIVYNEQTKEDWRARFPAADYPVLALRGTPASYPIQRENIALHAYLRWSHAVREERDQLIAANLKKPFVGIHIRNAVDFDRACEHVDDTNPTLNFMASPQCLGYSGEYGKLTRDLCYPPSTEIVRRTAQKVKELNALSVFVATAEDPMMREIQAAVGPHVKVVHLAALPHIDMAILAQSDFFIGNCVSSFTAAVRQERDVNNQPSAFFSFPSVLKK